MFRVNRQTDKQMDTANQWWYLVYFGPETLFEAFLGLAQCPGAAEAVQVCQHSHDLGEAMHLQHIEELKRLHLKAKASINKQQHLEGDKVEPLSLKRTASRNAKGFSRSVLLFRIDQNASLHLPGRLLLQHRSYCLSRCHTL